MRGQPSSLQIDLSVYCEMAWSKGTKWSSRLATLQSNVDIAMGKGLC
jgi:hypothetical protein